MGGAGRVGLGIVALLLPSLAAGQALMAERFGYCQVMDEGNNRLWLSPAFEHETAQGRMHERRQQDAAQFAATVAAQAAVTPGVQAMCLYLDSREEAEKRVHQLRVGTWGGSGPNPLRMVAWTPSALPAPVAEAARAAVPVPAAVLAVLQSDPFFQLPAGAGTLRRSGKRETRNDAGGTLVVTPVSSELTAARADDGLCAVEQKVVAGQPGEAFTTTSKGLSWAGLLPVALDARMASNYAVVDSRQQATALTHEGAPLFPLVQGNVITLRMQAASTDADGAVTPMPLEFRCEVGATQAASTLVAEADGDATELRCDMRYAAYPDLPPQPQVYHWFSQVGCFLPDPTRP